MKQVILFLVIAVLGSTFALPVTKNEPKKEEKSEENKANDVEVGFYFSRKFLIKKKKKNNKLLDQKITVQKKFLIYTIIYYFSIFTMKL